MKFNSIKKEFFVLTTQFNIYFIEPVFEGLISPEDILVNENRSQFIAESDTYNNQQREITRGMGLFVRNKVKLDTISCYTKIYKFYFLGTNINEFY